MEEAKPEQWKEAEPEQRRKEEREETEPEQRRKEARAEEAGRVTGLSWGGRSPSSPRPGNGAARGPGGRRKQIRAGYSASASSVAARPLHLHLRRRRRMSPPPPAPLSPDFPSSPAPPDVRTA